MELKTAGDALILHFNPIFTIAIASLAILLGIHIRKRSAFLDYLCLPVALLGGVFVLLARYFLYFFFNTEVVFDVLMLPYFFLAFFATIGLNGSIPLIRQGGMALFYCVAGCWIMSIVQNLVGIGMANSFGIHPTFGVLAGAVSLAGGHGAALAFGSLIESNGIVGAEAFGLAAATFGVLAASTIGPPIGKYLIARHNVKIETTQDPIYSKHLSSGNDKGLDPTKFLRLFTIVLVCMALGSWIGEMFNTLLKGFPLDFLKNFSFPGYIWVMLIAVIIRNAGDAVNVLKICANSLDLILSLSLRYAVAFVVMSISTAELRVVALPLVMILLVQTVLVIIISIYLLFPILGKDYDAAVICAGLSGLLLGASHSSMSNISTLCEHHNKVYSQKAFLVISLCGATLVDIFMLPFSSVCISMLM